MSLAYSRTEVITEKMSMSSATDVVEVWRYQVGMSIDWFQNFPLSIKVITVADDVSFYPSALLVRKGRKIRTPWHSRRGGRNGF